MGRSRVGIAVTVTMSTLASAVLLGLLAGRLTPPPARIPVSEDSYTVSTSPGVTAGTQVYLTAGGYDGGAAVSYLKFDVTMPAANEATLVAGLKLFAEMAGEYPEELDSTFIVGRFAGVLAAKALVSGKADSAEGLYGTAANQSMKLAAGCQFYQQLVRDSARPEYFGADVTPGDAKAMLVRWQLKDGQQRVIYGDLRAETVAGER